MILFPGGDENILKFICKLDLFILIFWDNVRLAAFGVFLHLVCGAITLKINGEVSLHYGRQAR